MDEDKTRQEYDAQFPKRTPLPPVKHAPIIQQFHAALTASTIHGYDRRACNAPDFMHVASSRVTVIRPGPQLVEFSPYKQLRRTPTASTSRQESMFNDVGVSINVTDEQYLEDIWRLALQCVKMPADLEAMYCPTWCNGLTCGSQAVLETMCQSMMLEDEVFNIWCPLQDVHHCHVGFIARVRRRGDRRDVGFCTDEPVVFTSMSVPVVDWALFPPSCSL